MVRERIYGDFERFCRALDGKPISTFASEKCILDKPQNIVLHVRPIGKRKYMLSVSKEATKLDEALSGEKKYVLYISALFLRVGDREKGSIEVFLRPKVSSDMIIMALAENTSRIALKTSPFGSTATIEINGKPHVQIR